MEEGLKRGRKPKPRKRVKRGRKKIAEEEIQARKKEGAHRCRFPSYVVTMSAGACFDIGEPKSFRGSSDEQHGSATTQPGANTAFIPSPLDESDDDELQPSGSAESGHFT